MKRKLINKHIAIGLITIQLLLIASILVVKSGNIDLLKSNKNEKMLNNDVEYLYSDTSNYDVRSLLNEPNWSKMSDQFTENRLNQYLTVRFKLDSDMLSLKDRLVLYFDSYQLRFTQVLMPIMTPSGLQYYSDDNSESLGIQKDFINPYLIIPRAYSFDHYLYLTLENPQSVLHPVLSYYNVFTLSQNQWTQFLILCFGFTIALSFINLALFYFTKETPYVFHAIYLVMITASLYFYSDMYSFVSGKYNALPVHYLQIATIISSYLFALSYTKLTRNHKKLAIALKANIIALAMILLIIPVLHTNIAQVLIRISMISSYTFLLFLVNYLYFKDQNLSIYYYVGTMIIISTGIIHGLTASGIFESNLWTKAILFVAAPLEAIIFTMGILIKVRDEKVVGETLLNRANTDPLTGLYNRHYFNLYTRKKLLESASDDQVSSMMIIDIDHFKRINDTYGHPLGDEILINLSRILSDFMSESHATVLRWGGEEFAVFLSNINLDTVYLMGEKLRLEVSRFEFPLDIQLTISIGVSQKMPYESFNDWYMRTDQALYVSKNSGRNRVTVAELTPSRFRDLPKVEWLKSFESGNEKIDEQHFQLLVKINQLLDHTDQINNTVKLHDSVKHLLDELEFHFSDEEDILNRIKYPDLDNHKREHQLLLAETNRFKNAYLNKKINLEHLLRFILNEVIMDHLLKDDSQFFPLTRSLKKPYTKMT